MSKLSVGDKVKFVKQVETTTTPISIGSVGILCDVDNDDVLNHYVVFRNENGETYNDWFTEDELEVVYD